MFDTREKRLAGWVVVALFAVWFAMATFWPSETKTAPFSITPAQLDALAKLEDSQYADWVTELYESLPLDGTPTQILILQGSPEKPPQIIATARDSSDHEDATHWDSPWEPVNEAMKSPLKETVVVNGSHLGVDYVHQLVPFDETGTRCLLINRMEYHPTTFGRNWAPLVGALLLAGALLASRE